MTTADSSALDHIAREDMVEIHAHEAISILACKNDSVLDIGKKG
jgi:hypothetical protein